MQEITNKNLGPETEVVLAQLLKSELHRIADIIGAPKGKLRKAELVEEIVAQLSRMVSSKQAFTIVVSEEPIPTETENPVPVEEEDSYTQTVQAENAPVEQTMTSSLNNMTRDELLALAQKQDEELTNTMSELTALRTTSEVVLDAAKAAGKAVARGGAIATIGTANMMARDQLLKAFGDDPPDWVKSQLFQDGTLVVPPALMLAIVDIGPHFGLPVPEAGRDAVRAAAIIGLEHAGIKNTEAAAKKAWEIIAPMFAMYRMAGEQAKATGMLEEKPNFIAEEARLKEAEPAVEVKLAAVQT